MSGKIVLVADDDATIRTVVSRALARADFEVRTTGSAAQLWNWIERGIGDVVVTDVIMPDANGLDLVPRIAKLRKNLPVIVMSAQNTLTTAVRAAEAGAYEYLPKPFDIKALKDLVEQASAPGARAAEDVEGEPLGEELPLIGRSQAMQEVFRIIARVVGNDLTVLITGESGTGKELVARAIHDMGRRSRGSFVALNMAAIPKDLIESELFGHEKGAFTGAHARTEGKFAQAQGGTLFLDEIGDMPLEAQTRLLRVLQEEEFVPVGGGQPVRTDVRVIAATHRNLELLVDQGLFREDLFFRLNVIPMRLPALRERLDDIPELARHFFRKMEQNGLPFKTMEPGALDMLRRHSWPGNVRELENLIQRLAALCNEDVIVRAQVEQALSQTRQAKSTLDGGQNESLSQAVERLLTRYFAAHGNELPPDGLYGRILQEVERPLLETCMAATSGNQLKAAKLLGLNRNTLRKKLKDHELVGRYGVTRSNHRPI